MRIHLLFICFLACYLLFGGIAFCQAAAIKVFPPHIQVKAKTEEVVEEKIVLYNPDDHVALFEVYPDNFAKWIEVKPASLFLESGATRELTLVIKNKEAGIYATNLSVVSRAVSSRQFKAAAGVKIPIEVSIEKNRSKIRRLIDCILHNRELLIVISGGMILLIVSLFMIWIK